MKQDYSVKANKKVVFRRAGTYLAFLCGLAFAVVFCFAVLAQEQGIPGKAYVFGEKDHYEISTTKKYFQTDVPDITFGRFFLRGHFTLEEGAGLPTCLLSDGDLSFYYSFAIEKLKEQEAEWVFSSDSGKTVDGISLPGSIGKGAVLIQTSRDQKDWVTRQVLTDAFASAGSLANPFFKTKALDPLNGMFYRVILAYKMEKTIQAKRFLPDEKDYLKYAEVYTFRVESAEPVADQQEKTHYYRERDVLSYCGNKPDRYSVSQPVEADNPHSGWDLGRYFVSGYQEESTDWEGNQVYTLKEGEKLVLGFCLDQDINGIDGEENLNILEDEENSDVFYLPDVSKMDFGRGALFVCYTDPSKKRHTTYYTNFLEGDALLHGKTGICLLEEGSYEVAMDYKVGKTNKKDTRFYQAYFKFTVKAQ